MVLEHFPAEHHIEQEVRPMTQNPMKQNDFLRLDNFKTNVKVDP